MAQQKLSSELKFDSSYVTKSKNRCCFSTTSQTLVNNEAFEVLVNCDFILGVLSSKSLSASNPKGLNNLTYFSEGTENFKI